MECIHGKRSYEMDRETFLQRIERYQEVVLDIGTGDGRFVTRGGVEQQARFFVGLDASRENMRRASRKAPPNALFVAAAVQALPSELREIAALLTVNFPWGSLLQSLLRPGSVTWRSLMGTGLREHRLLVTVNAGAMEVVTGLGLDEGIQRIAGAASQAGYAVERQTTLDQRLLRELPSTWAKRLAFGRSPVAESLHLRQVPTMDELGCDPSPSCPPLEVRFWLAASSFSFLLGVVEPQGLEGPNVDSSRSKVDQTGRPSDSIARPVCLCVRLR